MKLLKNECRIRHQRALFGRSRVESLSKLSREYVVRIVLDAIKYANIDNIESRCIHKSFDTCGVNHWCSNLEAFEDHLARLSDNKNYKALLDNNNNNDID